MKTLRTHSRVAATALAVAVAAVVGPATTALAHVTVNPREAAAGTYAKLAFRVPNERDAAQTTRLEIAFPAEHPFASVSVRPTPGWTYDVEKTKLATPVTAHGSEISEAVSRITWTGGAIEPGEFQEFEVSVGRLPENVDSLAFKALQTYSDGEIVRWIEETGPGGEEPDRPAPVLELTNAAETDEPGADETAADPGSGSAAQGGELSGDDEPASKSDVDTARVFGILGMVFGLLGFVSAMAARRRRDGSPASGEPA